MTPSSEPTAGGGRISGVENLVPTNRALDELARVVTNEALRASSRCELCWVLIRSPSGIHVARQVPNRHPDPENFFEIHHGDVVEAVHRYSNPSEPATLVGYVHTHPRGGSPLPSAKDVRNVPPGMVGGVHMSGTRHVHWYQQPEDQGTSRIGRIFSGLLGINEPTEGLVEGTIHISRVAAEPRHPASGFSASGFSASEVRASESRASESRASELLKKGDPVPNGESNRKNQDMGTRAMPQAGGAQAGGARSPENAVPTPKSVPVVPPTYVPGAHRMRQQPTQEPIPGVDVPSSAEQVLSNEQTSMFVKQPPKIPAGERIHMKSDNVGVTDNDEPSTDIRKELAVHLPPEEAARLVVADLAMNSSISYYGLVLKMAGSYPPSIETVMRTAGTLQHYYRGYSQT